MKVKLSKQAEKFLKKQDVKAVKRIVDAMEGLKERPFKGDIKVLSGREELRLRIGDYRVIFQEINNEINILYIGSRGDVYKK